MTGAPRPAAGDRFFRLLLWLYPRSFRERFGEEMIELFRSRRPDARGTGARFACRTVADVLTSVWRVRRRESRLLNPVVFACGTWANVRDGARFVRRSPGLSLSIVLLTMVTIGATTTVFSVVNAALLRPLPFHDPGRLVTVWEARPARHIERNVVGGHEFPLWNARNHVFERMAAIAYSGPVTLTGAGDPKALAAVRVTAGFFDVLGVRPIVGRGFLPGEEVPGRGRVAVLSERLWRERFGGDRQIAGRTILLDARPFVVAGVVSGTFDFPQGPTGSRVDIWSPLDEPIQYYRGRHFLTVIARLGPGVSLDQARADMARVTADVTRQFPDLNNDHEAHVVPLQQDLVRDARASLLLLFGAVGCLLVIGCSNVAGLLVARGLTRRHEIGVRLALGASRLDVARQLLAESLLLSIAGALLGVAATYWIAGAIPSLVPRRVLALEYVGVDPTVLGFALVTSLATGLLFGLAPALQVRRVGLATALQRAGRTLAGAGHPRVRQSLVAAQIALTLMLVLGAGLTARGLLALEAVDPGYTTNGLLAVDLALPASRYPGAVAQRRFFGEVLDRVAALPGITSVAATNALPLGGGISGMAIEIEGRPAPAPGEDVSARYRIVTSEYFRTLEIPLVAGRAFSPSDARIAVPLVKYFPQQPTPEGFALPQPQPVAVVNRSMARQFWADVDPIGRRFRALLSPWITVVGVVEDTRNESLREPARPEFYLHDLQEPQAAMSVLVRTASDPSLAGPAIRSAIRDLDPGLAITSMRPMADVVGSTFGLPRLTSSVVGAFAAIALGLMAAGIYGMMAFSAAQRLPELGLRMALGADRRDVVRVMVRQGLGPAAVGIVCGLAGAAALTRLVRADVFGVPAVDPPTWIGVTVLLLAAIVAASWWPVRRASRVDPAIVLRA